MMFSSLHHLEMKQRQQKQQQQPESGGMQRWDNNEIVLRLIDNSLNVVNKWTPSTSNRPTDDDSNWNHQPFVGESHSLPVTTTTPTPLCVSSSFRTTMMMMLSKEAGVGVGIGGAADSTTHPLVCPLPCPFDPTPIDTQQVNVVNEIKLGSMSQILMKEYNDSASAEILQGLLFLSPSLSEEQEEQQHTTRDDTFLCGIHKNSPVVTSTTTRASEPLYMNHQVSCSSSASSVSSSNDNKDSDETTTTVKKKKKKNGRHISHYNDERWDERFQELLEYRKQYGHVHVPHDWPFNKPLAQWVKRQRYQSSLLLDEVSQADDESMKKKKQRKRKTTLTQSRFQALANIGFVWSKHSAAWEEKFLELERYRNENGHCYVPSKYPPNRTLSIWVRCQRRNFRQSVLSKDRIERLQAMGFDFEPRGGGGGAMSSSSSS